MSFEPRITRHFSRDGRSRAREHTLGQGAEGRRPAFPRQRLAILILGLLNVILLVAAAVIGIYCARAKDFQLPDSAVNPLIAELLHLRNQTEVSRAKTEAEAALARERAGLLKLKMQVKEKAVLTDILQKKFMELYPAREYLRSNKTALEESCGRCAPGWHLLKTTCYYFSRAEPVSRKNWNDSRADCVRRGADLLVVDDLEEQKLISDNFMKVVASGTWWVNGFWMGLSRRATEAAWVWVNNATEASSICWKNGHPTNTPPLGGNCAAFYYLSDRLKTWYNLNCGQNQLNWICEMPPRT